MEYNVDLVARRILSIGLLFGYFSNVVSGFIATDKVLEVYSIKNAFSVKNLYRIGLNFFWPFSGTKKLHPSTLYWLPWVSTMGVAWQFLAHLNWFVEESWVSQPGIYFFLAAHFIVIWAVHMLHYVIISFYENHYEGNNVAKFTN